MRTYPIRKSHARNRTVRDDDADMTDMCRVDRRQRVALLAFRYRGMSRSNEAEY